MTNAASKPAQVEEPLGTPVLVENKRVGSADPYTL
jgi:hypothetical protein